MRRPPVRPAAAAVLCAIGLGLAVGWRTPPPAPVSDPASALGRGVPPPVMLTLRRACYDCHSNDTHWPWYASVPPASWLVAHDVAAARGQLNFSRWQDYNPYDRADMLDKICDLATKGRMPLWPYRLAHREARLDEADVRALCAWADDEAARLVAGGA
jgi:hypothetical protein